jgi:MFS family permease
MTKAGGWDLRSWLVIGSLFLSLFMLQGACFQTLGLFVDPYVRSFRWSRTDVSLLFTATSLAWGLALPLTGWLMEWLDAGIVIAAGALCASAALIATRSVTSLDGMLAAYSLLGIGFGLGTFVPQAVVVSNWFSAERGLVLGVVMAGQAVGGLLMAPALSYSISWAGWRTGALVLGLPTLLVVPSSLLFVRTRPPGGAVEDLEGTESLPGLEVAQALRTRSFWLLVIVQFCYTFAIGAPLVHIIAYLLGLHYTQASAAFGLALINGLAVFGQPLMGGLADRIGGRAALSLSLGVIAISLVTLVAAQFPILLSVFILVYGLMMPVPAVLLPVVLADSLGYRRYSKLLGLVGVALMLGLAVAPVTAGWIYDATGSYKVAFELCVIMAILASIATLACVPWRAEQPQVATIPADS